MENLFDKPVKRRGTGSLKWDVAENELPMWVADMDFETAPPVKEAILKRVEHGVFGYTDITPEWCIVPIRAGGKTVTDLKWKRSGSFLQRVSFRQFQVL